MSAQAAPYPIEHYPAFVCVSRMALSKEVLEITKASPLTLLLYLQTKADFKTGQRTRVYDHTKAATALRVNERTVRRYFQRLVDAGLVVVEQHPDGPTFRIARQAHGSPGPAPEPAHFHTQEPDSAVPGPDKSVRPAQTAVSAPRARVENPDSESTTQRVSEEGGGTAAAVERPPPQAPPPQIKVYDEIFAPVRSGPLEEWRWSCITKTVGLDERSLLGWTMACQRWLGNKQDPEKVVTLVTSYREKFQPKTGPGSVTSLGSPDEPAPEAPPPMSEEVRRADWERARRRIAEIRERQRWGRPPEMPAGAPA